MNDDDPQSRQLISGIENTVTFCLLIFGTSVAVWITCVTRSLLMDRMDADSTTTSVTRRTNHTNNNNNMHHSNCPICLSSGTSAASSEEQQVTVRCETNCGHVFCVSCFMAYWRHEWNWTTTGPVRCPVCRQSVNLLMTFTPSSSSSSSSSDDEQQVQEYNRRFSGSLPSLVQQLRDLPTLLRHLSRDLSGSLLSVIRFRILVCFTAAVAYLISPLDLVPEALFGLFGLVDDLLLILLMALYVCILYRNLLSGSLT